MGNSRCEALQASRATLSPLSHGDRYEPVGVTGGTRCCRGSRNELPGLVTHGPRAQRAPEDQAPVGLCAGAPPRQKPRGGGEQDPSYLFLVEGVHPLHGRVQGCHHVQEVLVLLAEGIGEQVQGYLHSRFGQGCKKSKLGEPMKGQASRSCPQDPCPPSVQGPYPEYHPGHRP